MKSEGHPASGRQFPRVVMVMVALIALVGCGGVSTDKAAADYAKLNPGNTVISARASEVDVIGYTFEITFQAPGDPQIRTTEFGYVKTRSGEWVPRDTLSTMGRTAPPSRGRRNVRGSGVIGDMQRGVTTSPQGITTSPLKLFFR